MKKRLLSLIAGASLSFTIFAQGNFATKDHGFVHGISKNYEWPTDPEVLKKLDQWQDLKFGIMFHWGVYSVSGISESWALCSEDRFTARRKKILPGATYGDFKKWYWGLADSFNPTKFNPTEWADYSIAKGPYKDSKYSNVAYHVFDAFRQQNFMIGAYFSKPDWHCEYYWDPALSTPTRNPNYDIKKSPEVWAKYQQYTANQINELMSDYGKIDILWLDGGWVRKDKGQDIKLDEIMDNARKKQPGLIAVDRTVPGRNENYQTPELRIPKTQLNHPWESNITLTNTWGWNPNPKYKSVNWVINSLTEVVAKGGCLVLNVGPTGEGIIEEEVIIRLKKVGEWLRKNGAAIYSTRITPNYNCGNVWFTANKDGKTLYAIYALPEGEELPEIIEWEGNEPSGKMTLLQNGKRVKYTCENGKVKVTLPQGLKNETLAFSFKVKK